MQIVALVEILVGSQMFQRISLFNNEQNSESPLTNTLKNLIFRSIWMLMKHQKVIGFVCWLGNGHTSVYFCTLGRSKEIKIMLVLTAYLWSNLKLKITENYWLKWITYGKLLENISKSCFCSLLCLVYAPVVVIFQAI